MIKQLFPIIVLYLSLTKTVIADEIWTIASEANFYPYNYWEKGKRTGLDAEIVEAILADMRVTPIEHAMTWPEVVAAVDTGTCDMGYQFTEYWRKKHSPPFILVGPFRYGKIVFVGRSNHEIKIDSFSDLLKYRIGVVDGYHYTEEFDTNSQINKLVSASATVNLRRLLIGRVDLIIGDQDSLRATAEKEGSLNRIYILPTILADSPRFFAFPHNKGDKAQRFSASFEKLKQNGTIEKICKTWIK